MKSYVVLRILETERHKTNMAANILHSYGAKLQHNATSVERRWIMWRDEKYGKSCQMQMYMRKVLEVLVPKKYRVRINQNCENIVCKHLKTIRRCWEHTRSLVKNHLFLPEVYRSSKSFLICFFESSRCEGSLKVSAETTPFKPSNSRA